jgi:cation:H+ antiporter
LIPLLFILGLVLLVTGGDLLVKGAARIAAVAHISPLVIGLTVVAFGTSTPELAVTVTATLRGEPDLALGNVVGSNITNLLLILGLSAVVAPLFVSRRVIRLDMPVLIAASIVVVVLSLDGVIGRGQGGALLAAGLGYSVLLVRHARRAGNREAPEDWEAPTPRRRAMVVDIISVLGGLVLLTLGSRWLVLAATAIAEGLGVSHLAIGLTVVAIGTSLPELATSVLAGLRNQADIAVGNVLGSNLFNLLIVLGAGAALSPEGISAAPAAVAFDMPVMLAVTVACLIILYTGRVLSRWEGVLFLAYFVAYTTYVLVIEAGHGPLPLFRDAVLFFALPLSALSFVICLVRIRRRQGRYVSCHSDEPTEST